MKKNLKIILFILVFLLLIFIAFFTIDFLFRKFSFNDSEKQSNQLYDYNSVMITTDSSMNQSQIDITEKLHRDKLVSQEERNKMTFDNITMSVKDETITSTSATFTLTNKNTASCGYGTRYTIQRNILGIWIPLIPINFTLSVDGSYQYIFPGTSEYKQDWSEIYGNLGKGSYRFGQELSMNGQYKYIYAEFNI